jgi:hypothetical protein
MADFLSFISKIESIDLSEGEGNAIFKLSIQASGLSGTGVGRIELPLRIESQGEHESYGLINIPFSVRSRNNNSGEIALPFRIEASGYSNVSANIILRLGVQAEGRPAANFGQINFLLFVFGQGNMNILYMLCEDKNNNL